MHIHNSMITITNVRLLDEKFTHVYFFPRVWFAELCFVLSFDRRAKFEFLTCLFTRNDPHYDISHSRTNISDSGTPNLCPCAVISSAQWRSSKSKLQCLCFDQQEFKPTTFHTRGEHTATRTCFIFPLFLFLLKSFWKFFFTLVCVAIHFGNHKFLGNFVDVRKKDLFFFWLNIFQLTKIQIFFTMSS